jgi:hypothetical protein
MKEFKMVSLSRSLSSQSIFQDRQSKALASQADPLKVQHIETINKLGLFATAPKQTTAVLVPAIQPQVVAQQPQAEQEFPEVVPQPRAHIAEDSTWRKLLSCVPIVGFFILKKNVNSLVRKINGTRNLAEQANYVRIINHYKVAQMARVLLQTAIIISVVALTILAPPVGIGLGVLGAAIIGLQTAGGAFGIAYNSYAIYKNKQFIKHVQDGTPLTDRTIR